MAHKHRCLDPELWLPIWARGQGATVSNIKLHLKTGQVIEAALDEQNCFDCNDMHCCRHLEVDSRFERVEL